MEKQKIFKTAAFGFEKKDVLSYIDELNAEAQAAAGEQSEQIEALTQERDTLKAQMEALRTQLEEFTQTASGKDQERESLIAQNEQLREEFEKLAEQMREDRKSTRLNSSH